MGIGTRARGRAPLGLTLVELIAVLLIAGALAAFALPRMDTFLEGGDVEGEAGLDRFASDVRWGREQALAHARRPVEVCLTGREEIEINDEKHYTWAGWKVGWEDETLIEGWLDESTLAPALDYEDEGQGDEDPTLCDKDDEDQLVIFDGYPSGAVSIGDGFDDEDDGDGIEVRAEGGGHRVCIHTSGLIRSGACD